MPDNPIRKPADSPIEKAHIQAPNVRKPPTALIVQSGNITGSTECGDRREPCEPGAPHATAVDSRQEASEHIRCQRPYALASHTFPLSVTIPPKDAVPASHSYATHASEAPGRNRTPRDRTGPSPRTRPPARASPRARSSPPASSSPRTPRPSRGRDRPR